MDPIFHIPLTDEQKQILGEIAAIQGQIEWIMQMQVSAVLKMGADEAREKLGRAGVSANADEWRKAMRGKIRSREIRAAIDIVHKAIADLSGGRNDFIHAMYAEFEGQYIRLMGGGGTHMKPVITKPVMALRTSTGKRRAVKEMVGVRDEAAKISHQLWSLTNPMLNDVATKKKAT